MPLPWPFGGSTKWTKQLLFSYLENDDLVSFNPPSVAVTSGASISVNAVISGLGLPPEVGSFDILALRENLNRWPFYATFRRATNSVFVAARR